MDPLKTALVLGGGGARGAYEAGVVAYLRQELEPRLGRPLTLPILSGTSVGAMNACHLAADAEDHRRQVRRLLEAWRGLELNHVLHVRSADLVRRITRELIGKPGGDQEHGGLVDPRGLRELTLRTLNWPGIGRNLRAGHLDALAVSATQIATGRTFTFIQHAEQRTPPWSRDPHYIAQHARIGPRHALASAAIPLVFPPVRIGKSLFADGGIRLNVPLSPALRLGADRVIVVSLRHPETPPPHPGDEIGYATLPFLAGKTLNALTMDRTEQDLERLRRFNGLIDAGTRAFGPTFISVLNGALAPHRKTPLRYVRNILVHPSEDLGRLAAEFARSAEFKRRARGLSGHFIRRLAEREARSSADLLSYLLIDGGFAEVLIDLGRRDARALGERWFDFFSDAPQCAAEEARFEHLRLGGTFELA
ncbi:MAG: patatin-like phospholipase family protein [Myxococcaceae bacterium]